MSGSEPLLRVEGLEKYYESESDFIDRLLGRQKKVKAVDGVSFEIEAGETLGLVGESGCGKSSIGRSILQLREPTAGSVYFKGEDITAFSDRELRDLRKEMQIIFQNPQSSLNPRLTVNDIIGEALDIHGIEGGVSRDARIKELLDRVGLNASHANRYPHEFSGGQLQRIGIARALAVDPDFIVCDEPVSALDVSVQAQILNLLEDLQDELGIAYLFIAHDLSVVEHIADEIAVMYLGKMAEIGTPEELFAPPQHPYTEALLSAIPEPDPLWEGDRILLEGSVPSPIDPPSGCKFHTRCPRVIPPSDYEFEQAEWRAVMSLRHRAREEDIAVETFDAGESALMEALREELDLPSTLSDPEAEEVVQEALRLVADEEFEHAERVLDETFDTPCSTDEPVLRQTDAGRVACHLFDPAYEAGPTEGAAPDDGTAPGSAASGDD
ncbi:ABC transporter ATP-binding protein [Halorubrum ezzemoulense]|uniref:Peptide ABC transporter ATP-binding protein n=1 Tax=Halorubrum ezzemoulense TaxID=337243 RepID=A0A256JRJ1_HALEZ|nr:ABC transporter ATP-binding protein [Halorubrum ezzemoulense]MDB2240466.1 ABC transporter ATP-binding protein [Halorubrum ezzemoulense]MDB2274982.1 ABC transporter ATP-binding protein [Halorubrum ezzemoulense]MDB9248441.1 ABC transporter ATP-binding protein [Halorubrum ezzemoulense]MDB9259221.1 ABC transporter ATP-binding protein [Halorubrum ezzemoulense]MDB9262200.1 ABC transporter ATP-binding protein [Halorubrum ezzemoulense]